MVRSSSTVEDATTSSMAGQFTSLLDAFSTQALTAPQLAVVLVLSTTAFVAVEI